MVLSFTENFERVGFSPVEEARFFYNALEIKGDFNIKVLPSQDSPNVQQLAKDLPASDLWDSSRYKSKSDLARKVGKSKAYIDELITAANERKKSSAPDESMMMVL